MSPFVFLCRGKLGSDFVPARRVSASNSSIFSHLLEGGATSAKAEALSAPAASIATSRRSAAPHARKGRAPLESVINLGGVWDCSTPVFPAPLQLHGAKHI
jgi:hypothetical protein